MGKEIKPWLEEQGIQYYITSPYHYQSNGRVERFNQTVMAGLNKKRMQGALHMRLKEVIKGYNKAYHQSIKMSPEQAQDPCNGEKLRRNQYEVRLEDNLRMLEAKRWPRLKVRDKVLLKEELQRKKNEPLFKEVAAVKEVRDFDTYLLQKGTGWPFKRHISQLKGLERKEGEC